MKEVFLLLGTNLGNRLENLVKTISKIDSSIGNVMKFSSIYETSAWGLEDQPDFLNMVIQIRTKLIPEDLLFSVKELESDIGRNKTVKWGPREIDIDILYYEDLILKTETLEIPHPGIPDRMFTLIPLKEIADSTLHPLLNSNPSELILKSSDDTEVRMFLSSKELKDLILLQDGGSS